LDFQLSQNSRVQFTEAPPKQEYTQHAPSILGDLLEIQSTGTDYNPDEAEFLRQQKLKKKKKRGYRL